MNRARCLLYLGECLTCLNVISGSQSSAIFGTVLAGIGVLHAAVYAAGCAEKLVRGDRPEVD